MSVDFSLNLHVPPSIDSSRPRVENLDRVFGVRSFQREIDLRGGSYYGRFQIFAAYRDLRKFFDTYLGYEVRENDGRTWIGLIHEMELTGTDGIVENLTLDDLTNAVQATYIDGSGDKQFTAYQTDASSIGRYGRKETTVETNLDQTAAEELARTHLAVYAWPRPQVVKMNLANVDRARLDVRVSGYAYTLGWDFPAIGAEISAGRDSLSELVNFIVGQSAFLSAGIIQVNALQIARDPGTSGLALINAICDIGDADDEPWTFTVDRNLRLHYGPISPVWTHRVVEGRITDRNNYPMDTKPRFLRPGVFRRIGAQAQRRPSGWLSDSRDFVVRRVGVDAGGRMKISVGQFDEWEFAEAYERLEE